MPLVKGDRVAVMVNGLGATPLEELYILYRRVHHQLQTQGVTIHQPFIGEYATSLEMPGASITIMKLDAELQALLGIPRIRHSFDSKKDLLQRTQRTQK